MGEDLLGWESLKWVSTGKEGANGKGQTDHTEHGPHENERLGSRTEDSAHWSK